MPKITRTPAAASLRAAASRAAVAVAHVAADGVARAGSFAAATAGGGRRGGGRAVARFVRADAVRSEAPKGAGASEEESIANVRGGRGGALGRRAEGQEEAEVRRELQIEFAARQQRHVRGGVGGVLGEPTVAERRQREFSDEAEGGAARRRRRVVERREAGLCGAGETGRQEELRKGTELRAHRTRRIARRIARAVCFSDDLTETPRCWRTAQLAVRVGTLHTSRSCSSYRSSCAPSARSGRPVATAIDAPRSFSMCDECFTCDAVRPETSAQSSTSWPRRRGFVAESRNEFASAGRISRCEPPAPETHAHRRVHLPLALRVHAGRRRRQPFLLGDGDDDVRHACARVGRAVDEHLGRVEHAERAHRRAGRSGRPRRACAACRRGGSSLRTTDSWVGRSHDVADAGGRASRLIVSGELRVAEAVATSCAR